MSKARRDKELLEIDVMLVSERIANEADYRARGRHLKELPDEVLQQRWFAYLRREYLEIPKHRTEGNDIAAELALRDLTIHVPEDIAQAMQTEVDRIILRHTPERTH
ncbi:hypothetical protein KUL72_06885 [Bradyrhizobium arachidis]|uniref:hypothetical protein n=1 Tax=Bradyrhizobium arachidis TaxID=858423 RepID=UPI0021639BEE|nr:hypothetical protein [Bradyrhizobium arachidis]UVO38096.1 hypothetical protein KUL72_06885 [Bradyrhizobium arachidis]